MKTKAAIAWEAGVGNVELDPMKKGESIHRVVIY